ITQGIEVIYHASYTDTEALDMLEAKKLEHFVAPGLAWLINTCHHASEWGLTPEVTKKMGYHRELEAAVESMRAMRRRGIRILPGGDYGFAWTPHGTNAKDLDYFVKHVGMSTMEALLSATAWGGPMMRMGKDLGYIREGCLADILLIDGDPLKDITVLQDKARILAVMKDGEFHRAPPVRNGFGTLTAPATRSTRWAA
ncbi:MAG: amidohydrolase family protein, partial [Rhizobacter sp.]|nr:amidohydrolase family protein [Rhizobacter sp.]